MTPKNRQVTSVSSVDIKPKLNFFSNVLAIITACCTAVWQTAHTRPFIKVSTKGGTSEWLFDSGASVTCMSLKQFRQIPPEFRGEKLPNQTQLITADGNNLDVLGVYNVHITVSNRSIWTPIFVCRKLHSTAILGIDCISKLGIAYSGRLNSFFFDDILNTQNAGSFIFQKNEASFEKIAAINDHAHAAGISTVATVKIPPPLSRHSLFKRQM